MLTQYGGSNGFLFNHFTIADAMSAHLVNRFVTYNVKLPNDIMNYCENMRGFSPMAEWIREAESEDWTLSSAEIDVSASASSNNSTPFRSTAAVKSASLAEVIVASVIPVVPDIVDSAIFFSLLYYL